MSYILEALRRAETERERKRRVPGLHAQPVPSSSTEEPRVRHSRPWLWVVIGLGAGLLLAFLWRGWASDPVAEEAVTARDAVVGNVAPSAAAGSIDTVPAHPTASVATGNVAAAPPAAAAASVSPAPHAAAKPAPAKPGTDVKPEPATRSPAGATAPHAANTSNQSARPSAAAIAPEPRLQTLNELPEDLRRSVPALAFGGSVYSEIAPQRMVIFNGQVLREGDALTDDLLLEQIRPHSAVLRLRGQRFEVAF